MLRTSGKGSLVAVILLLLHLSGGQANARSVLVPMGDMGGKFFTLPTRSVLANTVMAAYQRPYGLNFEVWRPQGMPAGWYAQPLGVRPYGRRRQHRPDRCPRRLRRPHEGARADPGDGLLDVR